MQPNQPYKSRLNYTQPPQTGAQTPQISPVKPQQPPVQKVTTPKLSYSEATKIINDLSQSKGLTDQLEHLKVHDVADSVTAVVHDSELLTNLASKVAESKDVIEKHRNNLKITESKIPDKSLLTKAEQISDTISQIHSKLIKSDEYKLNTLKTTLSALREMETTHDSKITGLQATEKELTGLITKYGKHAEIAESYKKGLKGIQSEISNIKGKHPAEQIKKTERDIQALESKLEKIQAGISKIQAFEDYSIHQPTKEIAAEKMLLKSPMEKDIVASDIAKMKFNSEKEFKFLDNEKLDGINWKVHQHSSNNFLYYENMDAKGNDRVFSKTSGNFYNFSKNLRNEVDIRPLDISITTPMDKKYWVNDKSINLGKGFTIQKLVDDKGKDSARGLKFIQNSENNKTILIDKNGTNYRPITYGSSKVGSDSWEPLNPHEYQFSYFGTNLVKLPEHTFADKQWVELPDLINGNPDVHQLRSRDGETTVQVNLKTGENTVLTLNESPFQKNVYTLTKLDPQEAMFGTKTVGHHLGIAPMHKVQSTNPFDAMIQTSSKPLRKMQIVEDYERETPTKNKGVERFHELWVAGKGEWAEISSTEDFISYKTDANLYNIYLENTKNSGAVHKDIGLDRIFDKRYGVTYAYDSGLKYWVPQEKISPLHSKKFEDVYLSSKQEKPRAFKSAEKEKVARASSSEEEFILPELTKGRMKASEKQFEEDTSPEVKTGLRKWKPTNIESKKESKFEPQFKSKQELDAFFAKAKKSAPVESEKELKLPELPIESKKIIPPSKKAPIKLTTTTSTTMLSKNNGLEKIAASFPGNTWIHVGNEGSKAVGLYKIFKNAKGHEYHQSMSSGRVDKIISKNGTSYVKDNKLGYWVLE